MAQGEAGGGFAGVPTQISQLVPNFDPSRGDNLETWSQKVELVANVWPKDKYPELITRLILGCSGSAFQKLQLQQAELKTGDMEAVKKIISILGGTWGQVPLEKKFEAAERALFKITQKGDETNDSYLARADVAWLEMLQKGLDIKELQAYVVLRNSQLAPEDKKRVLVESGAEAGKVLTMPKVNAAVRMLGTSFFQDYTGIKKSRNKTYDQATLHLEDAGEDEGEEADAFQMEGLTEEDIQEQLRCEGDEDAILVAQFEDAATETLQNDTELAALFSTYQDARRRLGDKAKYRGFWAPRKGKGKSKGKWTSGKGQGKKTLSQRIMESNCRLCGQRGHWKQECPNKGQQSASSGQYPVSFAASGSEPQHNTSEALMQIPEIALSFQDSSMSDVCSNEVHEVFTACHTTVSWPARRNLREVIRRRSENQEPPMIPAISQHASDTEVMETLFASHGTKGVVDLGASQSVMGSRQVSEFLDGLPKLVRQRVRKCACRMVFRFGNQSTLTSHTALMVPINKQGLCVKIAVVEGGTPFLISNALLCSLGAVIDTGRQEITFQKLQKTVTVHLSSRNLFLLDFNDILPDDLSDTALISHSTIDAAPPAPCELKVRVSAIQIEPVQTVSPLSKCRGELPSENANLNDQCAQASVPGVTDHEVKLPRDTNVASTGRPPQEPSEDDPGRDPTTRRDSHEGRTGAREDRIWSGQEGTVICQGIQRPEVDQLVCEPLRGIQQEGAPDVHPVCASEDVGDGGTAQSAEENGSGIETESQGSDHQVGGGRGPVADPATGPVSGKPDRLGCAGPAEPDVQHREGLAGSDPTPASAGPAEEHRDGHVSASESVQASHMPPENFRQHTQTVSDQQWHDALHTVPQECLHSMPVDRSLTPAGKIRTWVNQFNKELEETRQSVQGSPIKYQIDVLEVFCSHQSQITHQVNQLGGRAIRMHQGSADLSTISGRRTLFQHLVQRKPKHVWFSPVCKAWCKWSQFNASRSLEAWEQVCQNRADACWQIALGILLAEHQVQMGGHLHWEQPEGSKMFDCPEMKPVHQNTKSCRFDMCRVGQLCDPESGMPIRKRMNVLTTDDRMWQMLSNRFCSRDHSHQQVQGSVVTETGRINRSTFTEQYPRKFARQIAKLLIQSALPSSVTVAEAFPVQSERPANKRQSEPGTGTAVSEAVKILKKRRIRFKIRRPREYPEPETPESSKRPRIQADPKEIWEPIFELARKSAPPRERQVIEQGALFDAVQSAWNDAQLKYVMVGRGVSRHQPLAKEKDVGAAPYRRMAFVHRRSGKIEVEPNWEKWEKLLTKQIYRPMPPSSISIIGYGNVSETKPPEPPRERDPDPQGEAELQRLESQGVTEDLTQREIIDLTSSDHGPAFLQLPPKQRRALIKVHGNLGHPHCQKLQNVLRQQNWPSDMVNAVADMKCSTCQELQRPKIQRSAAVKDDLDFGDIVAMDGISWKNQAGQEFNCYHFVDYATSYQTAVAVQHENSEGAINAVLQGWIQWAGAPYHLHVDSAGELNSDMFASFLQRFNIRGTTIAAEGHWQNAKAERHGGILQEILNRMDRDVGIPDFHEFQCALAQACMVKNQWTRVRGFPPEVLVFGKLSRVAASVTSDVEIPAHALAQSQTPEGVRFRRELQRREAARRAFVQLDNDQAIRRALVSRPRPFRSDFKPGDWVMVWKTKKVGDGAWIGPMKVVQQEGQEVTWVTMSGKLFRAPPEHVRPTSAVEFNKVEHQGPTQQIIPPGVVQLQDWTRVPDTLTIPRTRAPATGAPPEIPSGSHSRPDQSAPTSEHPERNPEVEQPDVEPSVSRAPSQTETSGIPEIGETRVPDGVEVPVPEDDASLFQSTEAWKCEVFLTAADLDRWAHHGEEEHLGLVVSAAKRQKSEVKLAGLQPEEQKLFQAAKHQEVASWLDTGTVTKILRHQLPEENILRCRWILTWKDVDADNAKVPQKPSKKAKARLVVLGYEDPEIENIPRDSPTLSRLGRMLLLQMIASRGWKLSSFDVKTAFLRGSAKDQRLLGMEPPSEMREQMKLQPSEICQLLKGAYGRVDAPYLWYEEFRKTLLGLNFQVSPFDPCLFLHVDPRTNNVHGAIGVHVDDGLCGGDAVFDDAIQQLEKIFPFGAKKSEVFKFTGIQIRQERSGKIVLQQEEYVKDIDPIVLARSRRTNPEESVSESERQQFRALIGSLQYAAVNTRPDLSHRLGLMQGRVNQAQVQDLLDGNRLLHEAKANSQVSIQIQPIPFQDVRFLTFSDASFMSAKTTDAYQGMFIFATNTQLEVNQRSPVNPISWHSKKIQKVVTSTLAAETMALAQALDNVSWIRLFWSWMISPSDAWKLGDQTLLKLPPAIASVTYSEEEVPPIPVSAQGLTGTTTATDCKSLYDLVSRTAPPNCQEFRVLLQARLIKEQLKSGITLRWVPSGAQIADALTKAMDPTAIRTCLQLGRYALQDEGEMLKTRANAKARLAWLKANGEPSSEDA